MTSRWLNFPLAGKILLLAGSGLFVAIGYLTRSHGGNLDWGLYGYYSSLILHSKLPYKNFSVEFPPLALVAFLLPRLFMLGRQDDVVLYMVLFFLENALWIVATGIMMEKIAQRMGYSPRRVFEILAYYVLLVCVAAPYLPCHFDLLPAFLTVLGLYGLGTGKPFSTGLCWGLAIAAKIYPVVLVPIAFTYYAARNSWRSVAPFLLGCGCVFLLIRLVLYQVSLREMFSFLTFQLARGIQIESMSGALLVLGHVLGLTHISLIIRYGAWHLRPTPVTQMIQLFLPILFAVSALSCIRNSYKTFQRNRERENFPELVQCLIAVLLLLLIFNKVFSPQYLIWVLPFIPLVKGYHTFLFAIVVLMTTYLYPYHYVELLYLRPGMVWWLNARNGLLLATLLLLLLERRRVRYLHA